MQIDIYKQLASEIKVSEIQVKAAVELLDSGATVPFIARYRKEVTNGLDDIQLRELEARLGYLRELTERRVAISKVINEQGKLTPMLILLLENAATKQELEDIYAPFKAKRRTKGQLAREAGLEMLAVKLWAEPRLNPNTEAESFVKPKTEDGGDFSTVAFVLDGVRDIWSETWAEDAVLVQTLREWLWSSALLESRLVVGKDEKSADVAKFSDYFDYDEPISRIPSHRALAVFRGRTLGVLDIKLRVDIDDDKAAQALIDMACGRIAVHLKWHDQGRASDTLIKKTVLWTWRVKLSLSLERDLLTRLRESAEATAIKVFSGNLRDVLLAAPAGPRVVMGLDPGIRTGVKVAVVDATGKLMETSTVYPHEPRRDWDGALYTLAALCKKHKVQLIAIGNGTASRETDKLAAELIKLIAQAKDVGFSEKLEKLVVSEAGASIYSASEFASKEMPDVDVSLRGAASIARRLQDPLAELVKIEPKSIGVGQYQHDLNQVELARALDAVVEDCVNAVGVDLNTASVPLLTRVSGLSSGQANAVVRWRESNGAFLNRQQLLQVTGLGAKTFEQCAGFLRIRNGDNPLDRTSVHPESYYKMQALLDASKITFDALLGDSRDPRPSFAVARFNDDVDSISDLKVGMVLEGTVSNVAAFGAFVDVGVHQDGLVHVSAMSHKFIKDASEVVKAGDIVRVKVLEVDVLRKRIALTMRVNEVAQTNKTEPQGKQDRRAFMPKSVPAEASSMAAAFAKLRK